jgi:hypothetical protein
MNKQTPVMKRMSGSGVAEAYQSNKWFLLAALASGLVFIGSAWGADSKPPELRSLAFSPAAVDTSTAAVEVTLSFMVADGASGVSYFEAAFTDPSGVFRQSASARFAPTLSGAFSAKVTIPRFSAPGAWILSNVLLSDAAGNTLLLDTDALTHIGFPTRLEVRSAQDTTSPKLSRLEFTPSRIDTSLAPADVKVSFGATDDLAGVSYLELVFISPSGVGRQGGTYRVEATRSLSDTMTLTFPPRSEAGWWTLQTVLVADAANNTAMLNAEALRGLGFGTRLEVISAQDTEPPSLASIGFTPNTIDTSQGPATVEVEYRAMDALSGVTSLEVIFQSPSGVTLQRGTATFPSLNSVSDKLKVTFPRFSEPGEWTLSGASLADAAGNTLILDPDGLAKMGVQTRLQVTSAQATAPPGLTALDFTPKTISTARGAAEVTVAFRAADTSGVRSLEVSFVGPSGSMRVHGSAQFPPVSELTGIVKVAFPAFSEAGLWRMETLMVTDVANNTLILDADALARVSGLEVR